MGKRETLTMTSEQQPLGSAVCLVDVCGTLYDESTTAGFVRHMEQSKPGRSSFRFYVLEALRRRPFRTCVIALGKLLGRDIFRESYIGLLRGLEKAHLQKCAKDYAAHLDDAHPIAAAHNRYKKAEEEGWQVVLVSNSLDLVIEAIAKRKGLPWRASSLGWHQDQCLGRLENDLKANKLSAVKDLLGDQYISSRFMVITDNKTDRDLIEVSKPTVLVVSGRERAWMKGLYDELILH